MNEVQGWTRRGTTFWQPFCVHFYKDANKQGRHGASEDKRAHGQAQRSSEKGEEGVHIYGWSIPDPRILSRSKSWHRMDRRILQAIRRIGMRRPLLAHGGKERDTRKRWRSVWTVRETPQLQFNQEPIFHNHWLLFFEKLTRTQLKLDTNAVSLFDPIFKSDSAQGNSSSNINEVPTGHATTGPTDQHTSCTRNLVACLVD